MVHMFYLLYVSESPMTTPHTVCRYAPGSTCRVFSKAIRTTVAISTRRVFVSGPVLYRIAVRHPRHKNSAPPTSRSYVFAERS